MERHGTGRLMALGAGRVVAPAHGAFGAPSRSAAYGESCMLPPLRNVDMTRASALGAPLTLSDCSELSSSTCRDENGSKHVSSLTKHKQSKLKVSGGSGSRRKRSRPSGRRTRGDVKSGGKKVRSSKSNIPGESRYWTPSEHKLFIEAVWKYGPKNLKAISSYVGTRNMIQCRTHEQKCFMRLMREAQRENMARNGLDPDSVVDEHGKKVKAAKDVYSVSAQCGLLLLCAVGEEMSRV
ncbi:Myb-like protein I [Gracilariopsis chorda]|uniref:Myb-like protein I n=1 Tax=Gracilariopsis chorda TaxID=448386 RepID=A0A2V3IRD7_9FLOR|nr:Myb-like protein I [Gracilariopsis chorda]|eukprot:PXF44691.1 Myb-like protein I [Gracilariopsis chorda]